MKTAILIFCILGLVVFGCINQEAAASSQGIAAGSSGSGGEAATEGDNVQQAQDFSNEYVVIPISDISGTVKYFQFETNGKTVRYMVVRGSDGEIHTAFDACEVCYMAKKGYSQVGDSVKCNNCGLQFKIDDLGTKNKGAGCWPAYLYHEIKEDYIGIKIADLEASAYMF